MKCNKDVGVTPIEAKRSLIREGAGRGRCNGVQ